MIKKKQCWLVRALCRDIDHSVVLWIIGLIMTILFLVAMWAITKTLGG